MGMVVVVVIMIRHMYVEFLATTASDSPILPVSEDGTDRMMEILQCTWRKICLNAP